MEPFRGIGNIIAATFLWLILLVMTSGIAIVLLLFWAYFVFVGAPKRHESALEKLGQTLMPDEFLAVEAIQLRPFALFARRKSIGITNSRIIVIARGLFGGYTMRDIQWKDLQDAELGENVLPELCGSSLSFSYRKSDFGSVSKRRQDRTASNGSGPELAVGGVPSDFARLIYARAQAEEQAWEEKRRVRAIEETRAAAGGVYLNTGAAAQPDLSERKGASLLDDLKDLKQLLDNGVISDAEFQEMKAKIIARA